MKQYLYLPPQYDLVVGDTFELFYHGIVNFLTIDGYDFELFYEDGENRGKGFSRKYIFTPTEQDVGTHSLHVRLWSNEGEILEEKTTNISITMPPKSPSSERVILLIGASDAGPGVWPAEVGRRLIGIGGTPEGYGLENVSFIGSRERDGIRYEGYGGWSFTSYTTGNDKRNDFMIISGDFSDKNAAVDQHSTYRSENGFLWKLETISEKEMKISARRGLAACHPERGAVFFTNRAARIRRISFIPPRATRTRTPSGAQKREEMILRPMRAASGRKELTRSS